MSDKLARLEKIFREVLDDPSLEITPEFSTADCAGWDSVATVQIVLAAEQEFQCRLPTEAVAGVKKVSDLLGHLPDREPSETTGQTELDINESGSPKARGEALLDRARMRRDRGDTEGAIVDLRLAMSSCDEFNFWTHASKIFEPIAAVGPIPEGVTPIKIALLVSSTTEFLIPLLRMACLRDGLWAKIHATPFGTYRQEILNGNSALYRFEPDVAVIGVNWRDARLKDFIEDPNAEVRRVVDEVVLLWRTLKSRIPCTIIQHNFDMPAFGSSGHLGSVDEKGRIRALRHINERLLEEKPEGVIVLDFDEVAARFGRERWESPGLWHLAKQHPSTEALPLLVDHYLALIRARLGISKKVLVFDLDNTLWGGVIGEDGLGGIKIGAPSAEGEAFAALQGYALELKQRGILLAVCSKNDESDARLPLDRHEGMLLKADDFVAFVANWNDKPQNLRAIAKKLNLGVESFVFVDDNPVERARVRRELPEVAVVDIGSDPAGFVPALHKGLYFESLARSQEDKQRHESYRANVQREKLRTAATNVDDFLRRLQMTVYRGKFSDHVFDRVVQLLGKTNQFNLTTKRHSTETVRSMMADKRVWTQHFRLVDCYGDNGIVGLVVARESEPSEWEIDTFLMSCRVIGRRLEDFMMGTLLDAAKGAGCKRVRAQYLQTPKNNLVMDLLPNLGFAPDPDWKGAAGKGYFKELTGENQPALTFFAIKEV